MRMLLAVIVLFTSLALYGENVTSTVEGIITYLPDKDEIIREGDVLVKYDAEWIDYDISEKKLEIEYATEELKDLKSDILRYKKLVKSKVVSIAACEDIHVLYHEAKMKLGILKIQLKKLESDKGDYVIHAPYNCQITKVVIATNSGGRIGDEILEVKRI
jgi:hypothetical protein